MPELTADQMGHIWNAFDDNEKREAMALKQAGAPRSWAIRKTLSAKKQDLARDQSAAEDEAIEPTGSEKAAAIGMGAADGMTFGLADEARGALSIPTGLMRGKSVSDSYTEARDEARDLTKGNLAPAAAAGRSGAQLATAVGSGAASLAGALPAGIKGAAPAVGAKLGGAMGALQGFGSGEGAGESAALGAGGGAGGAALGAAAGAAPGLLGKLRLALARSTPQSQAKLIKSIPLVGEPAAAVRTAGQGERAPMGNDVRAMLDEQMAAPAFEALPQASRSPIAIQPSRPATTSPVPSLEAPTIPQPMPRIPFKGSAMTAEQAMGGGPPSPKPGTPYTEVVPQSESVGMGQPAPAAPGRPASYGKRLYAKEEVRAPFQGAIEEQMGVATPTQAKTMKAALEEKLGPMGGEAPRSAAQELSAMKWGARGSPESTRPTAGQQLAAPFKSGQPANLPPPAEWARQISILPQEQRGAVLQRLQASTDPDYFMQIIQALPGAN